MLYNNNVADTFNFRLFYGLTVSFIGAQTFPQLSTSRIGWRLSAILDAAGVTNAQLVRVLCFMPSQDTNGNIRLIPTPAPNGGVILVSSQNGMTEDSTVNKDLYVQVNWSAASANNSMRMLSARLELL